MILYFIQSTIILLISFGVYRLLLKKEKAFHFNRIYLLLTILFSFGFPLIEFESKQVSELISSSDIIQQSITPLSNISGSNLIKVGSFQDPKTNTLVSILLGIYGFISFFLLIRFSRNLSSLLKLISNNRLFKNDINFVLVNEEISPFSFFNYLFLNKEQYECGGVSKEILAHESIHGKQIHSIDILFIEVCLILFWFNPILWLYKNEISENHEYLADDAILKGGVDSQEYSNTILSSISTINQQALSCGFSFIQTKNRIKMLNKKKSPSFKIIGKLAFAFLLISFVLTISSYKYSADKPKYTVIIDAGHGGKDVGGNDHGLTKVNVFEKDITLSVVKELMKVDIDSELKLIYTRKEDKYLSLEERAKFANSMNADLFISLHVNSGPASANGLEIFLPKDSIAKRKSADAGKIMGLYMASSSGFEEFRIKDASYYLLKEVKHPSFFIELGFITNENDFALLEKEETIQSIAESLYKGLIDLKEGNTQLR